MFKVLVGLLTGLLFGLGMNVSQMVNPYKVANFLDVTGHWDASLAFVIGGALLVFVPFYHLLIKPRSHAVNGEAIQCSTQKTLTPKLLIGAAIFGIGWGMVGICPGPAVASLLRGEAAIYWFLFSMMLGHYASKRVFK
ncbi:MULTISPECIES: YeeE/YedE family protein [unclassified Agarivorans]|uniref:YeeE/YedE family protein n=1 Tax=unclassified Agarivorans TaxID=2636026 RepID=UPI0026E1775A|nr:MULTISPECIES: YeeE/YedE family protein [unclassified Agarivorans]MDO6686569.1 YeeE/YedE family protein [Agarivorans sp. 3_MG-2023]MDO6715387.1 YeeE/YedE family protein [Agarivorans sp. 2_MG-2023]